MADWLSHYENHIEVSQTENGTALDSAVLFLGIYLKKFKILIQKDI